MQELPTINPSLQVERSVLPRRSPLKELLVVLVSSVPTNSKISSSQVNNLLQVEEFSVVACLARTSSKLNSRHSSQQVQVVRNRHPLSE